MRSAFANLTTAALIVAILFLCAAAGDRLLGTQYGFWLGGLTALLFCVAFTPSLARFCHRLWRSGDS